MQAASRNVEGWRWQRLPMADVGLINIDDWTLDDQLLGGLDALGSDELEELGEYVGVLSATEAPPGGNGGGEPAESAAIGDDMRTASAASSNQNRDKAAAQEQRRKQQKIAKAKRWMLDSLVEYEDARSQEWQQRYVQEHKIFDTIAFALHYLADARLTFGGTGQEWQLGLAKDLSRLTHERDELLVLDALQPTLLILSKLLDFAPEAYSAQLFDACKVLARSVYDRNLHTGTALKGRACGDLYKVFNNIACLLLQIDEGEEAESWVKDATTLVRDDADGADVFLCNSASLIAVTSASTAPIENLLVRAQEVVAEAANLQAQALATLRDEIEARKAKIVELSDSFLGGLPPLGDEFLVRVDGDQVHKISATVPQIKAEIARLEVQVHEELEKQEKVKLRVMRVRRKLANFYARKMIAPPGPAKANKNVKELMEALKNINEVPLKDDVANACVIAAYYLRWICREEKVSNRRKYGQACFQTCKRVIERLEAAYGHTHTSKRSGELYEKGAIAAMLTRQDDALVQEWCIEGLRLQKFHNEGSLYHARALLCLAEAFGYCGDAEQGLISGKDAYAMYLELLGAGHMLTKKVNKVWIEHKKVMMKGAGNAASRRIFISRMDNKNWIRDWL